MGFQVGTVDELTNEAATIEILLEQAEALADEVAASLGIEADDEEDSEEESEENEEESGTPASPFQAPNFLAALGALGNRLQGMIRRIYYGGQSILRYNILRPHRLPVCYHLLQSKQGKD